MKTGERITDELTLRLAITQRPAGSIAVSYDEDGKLHKNQCIALYPSKWGPLCWLRISKNTPFYYRRTCARCGHGPTHP